MCGGQTNAYPLGIESFSTPQTPQDRIGHIVSAYVMARLHDKLDAWPEGQALTADMLKSGNIFAETPGGSKRIEVKSVEDKGGGSYTATFSFTGEESGHEPVVCRAEISVCSGRVEIGKVAVANISRGRVRFLPSNMPEEDILAGALGSDIEGAADDIARHVVDNGYLPESVDRLWGYAVQQIGDVGTTQRFVDRVASGDSGIDPEVVARYAKIFFAIGQAFYSRRDDRDGDVRGFAISRSIVFLNFAKILNNNFEYNYAWLQALSHSVSSGDDLEHALQEARAFLGNVFDDFEREKVQTLIVYTISKRVEREIARLGRSIHETGEEAYHRIYTDIAEMIDLAKYCKRPRGLSIKGLAYFYRGELRKKVIDGECGADLATIAMPRRESVIEDFARAFNNLNIAAVRASSSGEINHASAMLSQGMLRMQPMLCAIIDGSDAQSLEDENVVGCLASVDRILWENPEFRCGPDLDPARYYPVGQDGIRMKQAFSAKVAGLIAEVQKRKVRENMPSVVRAMIRAELKRYRWSAGDNVDDVLARVRT
ncbi:MAG: hypothetical protein ABH885_01825, partial [Candidatus Omnitrophota bacterium]